MAIFQNIFDIELYFNGESYQFTQPDFSFSLVDDIDEFYNTAELYFEDSSGVLQEYLVTAEGMDIDITFGLKDLAKIKSKLTIVRDELEETIVRGMIGGEFKLNLINRWYNFQEKISKSYQDRISEIIKKILQKDAFFDVQKIEGTGNEGIWYQGLINDAEFITKVLLPNAYSRDAANTPFYCFINSDNTFNLRPWISMFNPGDANITLEYKRDGGENRKATDILNIQRFRPGSYKTRKTLNREVYQWSEEGTQEVLKDKLTNYPVPRSVGGENAPVRSSERITNVIDLGDKNVTISTEENHLGIINNTMKDSMHLDCFIVTTMFNPSLKAGTPVNILVNRLSKDENPSALSQFSGVYLVKRAEHIWDGEKQTGFTNALVTRKYLSVNNDYKLKGELFK